MKLGIFIKNFVMITVILAVVFLSQQSSFEQYGGNLYVRGTEKVGEYWLKGSDWFNASIYPKASGGAGTGKEIIEKEIVKQKDATAKNIWEKIKNYFAGKFSNLFGTKVEED